MGLRVCAPICALFAACNSGGGTTDGGPDARTVDAGPPSAVDILFLIENDDTTIEQNLKANVPVLIDKLHQAPSGAPDLHIAIATADMGAGAFTGQIPGCGSPDMGRFIDTPRAATDPACTTNMLNSGQHFFVDGATRNYTGDLATALGCMLQLGANGCGFEHHLSAMRAALGDSANGIFPPDVNQGFWRADARLAIIIVANEDDCSVPPDSLLFDPNQNSVSDPLGPLASFRCTEFGITCDGLTANDGRIPRTTGGPYQNCRSNDAYATVDPQHSLVPAQVFIDYLHRIPDVVVASIQSPVDPFAVVIDQQTGFPSLNHSCSSSNGTFGDPGVRIRQVVNSLGNRGVVTSVCQDSYADAFSQIADLILTP